MPRLTLVPPTLQRLSSTLTEDLHDIIDELTAARDGLTDGPAILWLVNDLMRCCELLFEENESGAAITMTRKNYLSRLTGFADDIRRSNGELSDEFITFIATAPGAMRPQTTN